MTSTHRLRHISICFPRVHTLARSQAWGRSCCRLIYVMDAEPDHPADQHVAVYACVVNAPYALPAELQDDLAVLHQEHEALRPSAEERARPQDVQQRRRRRAAQQPQRAVRRPARRRRRAGGAHAEDGIDSSSSSDAAGDVDAGADAGLGGDDDDELSDGEVDSRPHIMAAVSYYKAHLFDLLSATLEITPRPVDWRQSPTCRVAAVASGSAFVLSEGEKGFAVWLSRPRDSVIGLCSCGGRRGVESVEVRELLDLSSSCVHARALMLAAEALAIANGQGSIVQLLEQHQVMNIAVQQATQERQVFYAVPTARKRAVFAVLYDGLWSVVLVRARQGRSRGKKRMIMRAACAQLSCAKDHWTCLHARAVSEWRAALEQEPEGGQRGGVPLEVRLPDLSAALEAPTEAEVAAQDARFSDESRWRGARNLLPCAGEIEDCEHYDRLGYSGSHGGHRAFLPTVLYEDRCFACSALYYPSGIKNTGGTLHTLRGRVAVRLQR